MDEVKYAEKQFYLNETYSKIDWEDFMMPTTSKITALNFHSGNTLTYSAYPDFYEYRILVKDIE